MLKPSFWAQLQAVFSQLSHQTSDFPVSQSSFSSHVPPIDLPTTKMCSQTSHWTDSLSDRRIPWKGCCASRQAETSSEMAKMTGTWQRVQNQDSAISIHLRSSIWKHKARETLSSDCAATTVSLDNLSYGFTLNYKDEVQRYKQIHHWWHPKLTQWETIGNMAGN